MNPVRLLVVLVVLLAAATAQGALRVALLVGQPDAAQPRQLPIVVSLAEAELAPHGDKLVLVERQAIDKVLAEQELGAAIGSADGAVRLGAILKADVIGVVLPDPSTPAGAALSIMVFDAQTGVRLIDAALAASTPQDQPEPRQAERLANHVLRAVEKAGKLRASAGAADGTGSLRAVSFLPARNVDLPRSEDPRCQALVRLIERQLTNRPEVIVLERAQLASVTRERELSGTTPSSQPSTRESDELAVPQGLRSSLIRVQLDVARAADAPSAVTPSTGSIGTTPAMSIEIQLTAIDARGKRVASSSARGTTDAIQLIGSTLARKLLQELGGANLDDPALPPAAEAGMLIREADLLWRHGRREQAVAVAEAAYALQPEQTLAIAARAHARVGWATDFYRYSTATRSRRSVLDDRDAGETVKLVLQATDAAMPAFRLASDRRFAAGGWSGEPERYYQATIQSLQWFFRSIFDQLHDQPRDPNHQRLVDLKLDDEGLQLLRSIQRQYHLARIGNDHRLDYAQVRDAASFAVYSRTLRKTLPDLRFAIPYGEPDNIESLRQVLEGWTDALFKHEPAIMSQESRDVFGRLSRVSVWQGTPVWTLNGFSRRSGHPLPSNIAEIELLRVTLQRLLAHPDPQMKSIAENNLGMIDKCLEQLRNASSLTQRRTRLDTKVVRLNPAAAAAVAPAQPTSRPIMGGTERYWNQVIELVDHYDPQGPRQFLEYPVVHGEAAYVLNLRQDMPGSTVRQLMRYPLNGDPPTRLGRQEGIRVGTRSFEPGKYSIHPGEIFTPLGYSHTTAAAPSTDGMYYWINDYKTVTLFPLAGGPPQEISVETLGLPDRHIDECAAMDGNVYASMGGGLLVRYNLATRQTETIVSAARSEQRSPLDNHPPFPMRMLTVDGLRKRLLFVVSTTGLPIELCGVWSYTPATGKVERLMSDLQDPAAARQRSPDGSISSSYILLRLLANDRLFVGHGQNGAQAILNLVTDQHTLLHPPRTSLPNKSGGPVWFNDGQWLWRGWARYENRGARFGPVQEFPPVRRVDFAPSQFHWPPYVQPIDEKRVLVADGMGMWVVVPPKPGTPLPPPWVPASLADGLAGGDLPYTRTRTLYDLTQTRDADYIVRPLVHENALYAVALLPDRSLQLLRFDLADGSRRDLAKIRGLVEWRKPEHGTRFQAVDWATGACITGTAYYLSTPNGNLFEFPLDGSPARHVVSVAQKAMPGHNRLASIDGKVVAVAGQLHPTVADRDSVNLKVYDPQTRQTTVIHCVDEASESLRADDGLDAQAIFADTPRGQLLMFIWPKELNAPTDLGGWWTCDISTGICRQVVPWSHAASLGPLTPQAMPDGNYWLWTGHITAWFNPTDGSHRLLAEYNGPIGDSAAAPDREQLLAAILRRHSKYPPTAVDDEWIWFAGGRLKRDGSLLEEFPDPRTPQSKSQRAELVQLIDGGKRLIVADQASCWVLDLR